MKKINVNFCLFLMVFSVACDQDRGENMAADQEKIDHSLKEVFEQNQLMGMAVVLLDQDEVIYQGSFGLADSSRDVAVDMDTKFRIASISKTFTALAVMQLVEQGKLDLEQDVSSYLGWPLEHPIYPEQPITLAQLLSHRSGIQDGSGYGKFLRDMKGKRLNISELFMEEGAYYTEDMFSRHAPGSFFSYTNCTYGLIATIVEAVSDQRFDEYCRQHIFEPLGMEASFNVAELEDLDELAVLYRYEEGQWKPQADNYVGKKPEPAAYEDYTPGRNGLLFGPQGSLRISAAELTTFSLMMLKGGKWESEQVIGTEFLETMLQSHWQFDGNNGDTWEDFFLSYGYGSHQTTNTDSADIIFPDRNMVGHPGIAYGLLSDMYIHPESGSGVIFVTNGSKKSYHYGEKTSFYQVEEDVFNVLYPYLQPYEGKE